MAKLATNRHVMIKEKNPAIVKPNRSKRELSIRSERAPIIDPKSANGKKRKSARIATRNAELVASYANIPTAKNSNHRTILTRIPTIHIVRNCWFLNKGLGAEAEIDMANKLTIGGWLSANFFLVHL